MNNSYAKSHYVISNVHVRQSGAKVRLILGYFRKAIRKTLSDLLIIATSLANVYITTELLQNYTLQVLFCVDTVHILSGNECLCTFLR